MLNPLSFLESQVKRVYEELTSSSVCTSEGRASLPFVGLSAFSLFSVWKKSDAHVELHIQIRAKKFNSLNNTKRVNMTLSQRIQIIFFFQNLLIASLFSPKLS